MTDRLHVNDECWGDLGGGEPDDFGREFRQFAIDAHRILGRPDSPVDEVFGLYRRAWCLQRQAAVATSSEIRRWLLAARQAIDVRLRSWVSEQLESSVA